MVFDFDHFDLDHFDQHQKYLEKHAILLRKHSRTAIKMPYLCIVNLREEMRAHEKKFTGPRGRRIFPSKCDERD